MDPLIVGVISGLVSLVIGIAGGYGLARVQDKLRGAGANAKVNEMLSQAKAQADNIRKDAELKVKDDLLKKREELTREFDQKVTEVREQERRLEKREDQLEQRND